eukprot:TRINITY_DN5601_c0_g1_i1.p1 TRINITY_DN5601_c0_g1~~TRINITY_DN5601_c0_g1_i1.p1  ORF type:complete len:281 (-),score=51.94 TRINITY_DN5601_c0_g1_i1:102-944(-)
MASKFQNLRQKWQNQCSGLTYQLSQHVGIVTLLKIPTEVWSLMLPPPRLSASRRQAALALSQTCKALRKHLAILFEERGEGHYLELLGGFWVHTSCRNWEDLFLELEPSNGKLTYKTIEATKQITFNWKLKKEDKGHLYNILIDQKNPELKSILPGLMYKRYPKCTYPVQVTSSFKKVDLEEFNLLLGQEKLYWSATRCVIDEDMFNTSTTIEAVGECARKLFFRVSVKFRDYNGLLLEMAKIVEEVALQVRWKGIKEEEEINRYLIEEMRKHYPDLLLL